MPKLKYEAEDGTLFNDIEDAHQYELACRFLKEAQRYPPMDYANSILRLLKNGWQIIPPPEIDTLNAAASNLPTGGVVKSPGTYRVGEQPSEQTRPAPSAAPAAADQG